MAQKKIDYFSRNFVDVREELFNFIRQYYPDLFSDFGDASVGTMFVELNAAVADMLSFQADRMFNETQINYAQQRSSIFNIARTLGLKIPNFRPSVTLVDFSVTVPPFGDTFDIRYAPVIRVGTQVIGAGQTFEVLGNVDFSSPFANGGLPNRLILPNFDSNGNIANYTLVKRELVVNGKSKIFTKTITNSDVRPFFELILPDNNVISVEQVITLEGTNTATPTIDQFTDPNNRWYEVDSLAENKIFVEDGTRDSDANNVTPGKWISIPRRFTKEFTDNGFCKLTFGSGTGDQDTIDTVIQNVGSFGNLMNSFINTTSLGEIPKPGNVMYVRYRVGGGTNSNLGPNTINSLGTVNVFINGPNPTTNQSVRRSLTVNNPVPAIGGGSPPTTEEVRNFVKYNFASQNRSVTTKDYLVQIFKMPSQFGSPYRISVTEEQNKVAVYVIGLNSSGKLSNQSTTNLKENLATWLSEYRMINDYVQINDGRIINLQIEADIFVDKTFNSSEVVNNTIQSIRDYFKVDQWQMGDTIYLSDLIENINNVAGVLNVVDLRIDNLVGGQYSTNESGQDTVFVDFNSLPAVRRLNTSQFVLNGEPNSMFEIKYPERDIKVRVKTN